MTSAGASSCPWGWCPGPWISSGQLPFSLGLTGTTGFSLAWRRRCKNSRFGHLEMVHDHLQRNFGPPELNSHSPGPRRKVSSFRFHCLSSPTEWSFIFLQESQPDGEFLSQSSEISAAPPHWQVTHTVWSSVWCNFQGGCNFNIYRCQFICCAL